MRGRCAGSDPRFVRRFAARFANALGRLGQVFDLGGVARLDLLGLLEAEKQLILRQRLGATAEAMTLQLLDDLPQAVVLRSLGEQHRLERLQASSGSRFASGRHGHTAIRSCVAVHDRERLTSRI